MQILPLVYYAQAGEYPSFGTVPADCCGPRIRKRRTKAPLGDVARCYDILIQPDTRSTTPMPALPPNLDAAIEEAWQRVRDVPGFLQEGEARFLGLLAAG